MDTSLVIQESSKKLFDKHQLSDYKTILIKLLQDTNALLLLFFIIFLSIVAISEFIMGFSEKTFHLMVDSLHNVLNILAFTFSLASMGLAKLPRNQKFTYGYLRLEIISSFATCCFLAFLGIFLIFRAIHDLIESFHEEGEHNHSTGSQRFDLLIIFNALRLAIYLLGAILFRNFSSLSSDPTEPSSLFSKFTGLFLKKNSKRDEDKTNQYKRYLGSHYMNLHTIYLHFMIGSLLTGTFVGLHHIEFFHQSNLEILFAIGLFIFTVTKIKPVMLLAADILLQALPSPHDANIARYFKMIKSIEGVVCREKPKYWALTPNYNVIYLILEISNPSLKPQIEQQVRYMLQDQFAEILIQVRCRKTQKQH